MKDVFTNNPALELPDTLPTFTLVEKHHLLEEFNNTGMNYPIDNTVIHLFEERAMLTPDAVALTFEDRQFTYKEVNEYANQLAHYLTSKGVKAETLVPVCIERSLQMIIGILGILKAGGAYVPVDPDYPAERIQFILEDTQPAIAVSSSINKLKLHYSKALQVVELDENLSIIQQQPLSNIDAPVASRQLAYIIYTSGSTGKPKGVMIEHKGLVNLALSQIPVFGLKPGMRTLQFASFGFDASCSEIFTTFLSGGCLVLPQKKDLLSAEEFEKLINKHQVTVVTLPPSYQLVIKDSLATINTIISAGEPLNETVGRYLQAKGIRLINAYGPTENTVCVSMSDDPIKDNHVIVIGKPIANVQVYILDKTGNLCPAGTAGEIHVAGAQVARGYLNRDDLTAEKFVENPFAKEIGAKMYKTGDLGRWHADGNIEFLGRADDQVKIRGYRIELGEVEHTLQQCSLVSQAVVIVKEDKEGNQRLAAYIIPKGTFDRKAVLAFLKEQLPEYMVPSTVIPMSSFPLTFNGKIDKKALPAPDMHDVLNKYAAPRTAIEHKLAAIWQKLFSIERVGIHENFFHLGGSSLLAIRVVSQAIRAGYDLQPNDFFIHQTIRQLAGVIQERLNAKKAKRPRNLLSLYGEDQSIIPFNDKGTKAPFFFMSPGFSVYEKVVSFLDNDQPFYFFIPYSYKSVEDIAAYYIREMKKIQPDGPYCLGGYCGFGEVALEMAQQLTASGEQVTFLALFEFYFPAAILPVNYSERLRHYYNEFKNISIKERIAILYGVIQRKLRKFRKKTSKAIDRNLRNLPETTKYLIGKQLYSAKPYNGNVLLFRSAKRTRILSDDPYMGWYDYFTGKVQLYTIEGDHKSMFKEPGAIDIAEKLKANAVQDEQEMV